MCQNYHKNLDMSLFLLHFSKRAYLYPKGTFRNHANGKICLCNMSALCNMKNVPFDMRSGFCNMRSSLCSKADVLCDMAPL